MKKFIQLLLIYFAINIAHAQTGNVGVGTALPAEKLQVAGNVLVDQTVIATKGLISGKIQRKYGLATTVDNAFHTVELDAGYGATAISVYSNASFDGDIKIIGTDISPLLSTTSAWYYTDAANTWTSKTAATVKGQSFPNEGRDNCSQRVYCPDGYIATGWEAHVNAAGYLEDRLHIKCTQLASGYTTVETNEGVESILSFPGADVDNMTHVGSCPTGTFIKGISIYTGTYYAGPLQVNCTGIKR